MEVLDSVVSYAVGMDGLAGGEDALRSCCAMMAAVVSSFAWLVKMAARSTEI